MRLSITTPLTQLVDEEVRSVRAEDASGCFGILPGHADFLTSLQISVLSWTRVDGSALHCAVRGGVFTVAGGKEVSVATPEGMVGDDLLRLEEVVRAAIQEQDETGKAAYIAQTQLQLNAIRQIMKHLQTGRHSGAGL